MDCVNEEVMTFLCAYRGTDFGQALTRGLSWNWMSLRWSQLIYNRILKRKFSKKFWAVWRKHSRIYFTTIILCISIFHVGIFRFRWSPWIGFIWREPLTLENYFRVWTLGQGYSDFGDNVMLVINVDDSLVGFFFGCCQKNIKSTTFVTNIDEAR